MPVSKRRKTRYPPGRSTSPDPNVLLPLLRIIQNVTAQREGIDAGILELDPSSSTSSPRGSGINSLIFQTVTAFDVTGYSSAKSPRGIAEGGSVFFFFEAGGASRQNTNRKCLYHCVTTIIRDVTGRSNSHQPLKKYATWVATLAQSRHRNSTHWSQTPRIPSVSASRLSGDFPGRFGRSRSG